MPSVKVSRSQLEGIQTCPTKDYWTNHHGGLGIERVEAALPLVTGVHVHAGLAALLMGQPLDAVVHTQVEAYRAELQAGVQGVAPEDMPWVVDEQSCLLEGLLCAWATVRLPVLLDEYEPLEVEREWEWPLPGTNVVLQCRFDALLRHRAAGHLVILDYKTVSYPSMAWHAAFAHSLQTVLYVGATRARYPDQWVDGIMYEGLCTGGRRAPESGEQAGKKVQQSILCYAYTDGTTWQAARTTRKGWERRGAWMYPGSYGDYLTHVLSPPMLADLFWHVPPIQVSSAEIEAELFRIPLDLNMQLQRVQTVQNWQAADPVGWWDEMPAVLPRHRRACHPYAGGSCPYVECCFDQAVGEDPLASGLYRVRVPHHPLQEVAGGDSA